jgi:peptidyl-prolyl cis-trans isomerase B (cyclophilin B)
MKKIISAILITVMIFTAMISLSSCSENSIDKRSYCEYRNTRDITGRELSFVKMTVKGMGTMIILIDHTAAPTTAANFMSLVNEGFYNGITFHRIIKDFVVQGGDPTGTGRGGSDKTIYGEFQTNGYYANDISHLRGVIAMARSGSPNSASSQFYFCHADSISLDTNYATFGYIIAGLNVVDKIVKSTVKYADSNSGAIADKSKQAVIVSATEISAEEAGVYLPK